MQSPETLVKTKAHLGLGQVYITLAIGGDPRSIGPAESELRVALETVAHHDSPHSKSLAAEAHARLGLLYAFGQDHRAASAEYEAAAAFLPVDSERGLLYKNRASELWTENNQGTQ